MSNQRIAQISAFSTTFEADAYRKQSLFDKAQPDTTPSSTSTLNQLPPDIFSYFPNNPILILILLITKWARRKLCFTHFMKWFENSFLMLKSSVERFGASKFLVKLFSGTKATKSREDYFRSDLIPASYWLPNAPLSLSSLFISL